MSKPRKKLVPGKGETLVPEGRYFSMGDTVYRAAPGGALVSICSVTNGQEVCQVQDEAFTGDPVVHEPSELAEILNRWARPEGGGQ